MGKVGPGFDADGYTPVAERIRLFYATYPLGRIKTQMVDRTDREIVFKALVYRAPNDTEPAATGWAAERIGDGEINAVACLENTETSAVGRALANLGFTGSRQRASAEEMAKVSRARARLTLERNGESIRAPSVCEIPTAEGRHQIGPLTGDPTTHPPVVRDVLALLGRAASLGLRASRIERWSAALTSGLVPVADLARCERRLRLWIERQRDSRQT